MFFLFELLLYQKYIDSICLFVLSGIDTKLYNKSILL